MPDKLTEIREALGLAIAEIEGVQSTGYASANMTTPTAVVQPGPVTYHRSMQSGHTDWEMHVRVYVGTVDDRGAQMLLDEFVGETSDRSIKQALEADTTLGGVVDDVTVTGCDGYQEYAKADGTVYLGAEWTVEIMAADN